MNKIIILLLFFASFFKMALAEPNQEYDFLNHLFESNEKAVFSDVNFDYPGVIAAIYKVKGEDIEEISGWLTQQYHVAEMQKINDFSTGKFKGWGTGVKQFSGDEFASNGLDYNYIVTLSLDTFTFGDHVPIKNLEDVKEAFLIVQVLDKRGAKINISVKTN